MTILSFVGNKEYHKVSDEFEIGPDLTMDCGVEHLKKNHHRLTMGLRLFPMWLFFFFLNISSFFLQETRMCIKAWMTLKFKQILPLTLE